MPRKVKSAKPLIYVFCEGESEQAYTDYLKKTFSDVAVLKRPPDTGLFEEAEAKFSKSPKYKNSIDAVSYTHLDVYKRQSFRSPCATSRFPG